MGRIRTIKPEFWTDPNIIACSMSARLLFLGIWNFCDDQGNIEAHPLKIKCLVYPADNVNIDPLLKELEDPKKKLLVRYQAEGQEWLHVRTFLKHQRIDHPSKPKCPAFSPQKAVAPEPQTGELFQEKAQAHSHKTNQKALEDAFEEFWDGYLNKLGKKRARRHFNANFKNLDDVTRLYQALDIYEAHLKKNPWKKAQQGDTFINNYEDWLKFEEPKALSKADEEMRRIYEESKGR